MCTVCVCVWFRFCLVFGFFSAVLQTQHRTHIHAHITQYSFHGKGQDFLASILWIHRTCFYCSSEYGLQYFCCCCSSGSFERWIQKRHSKQIRVFTRIFSVFFVIFRREKKAHAILHIRADNCGNRFSFEALFSTFIEVVVCRANISWAQIIERFGFGGSQASNGDHLTSAYK